MELKSSCGFILFRLCVLSTLVANVNTRRHRSVDRKQLDVNPLTNSVEFIWSTTTVAVGDTAVLHCSFDAIFQQLRSGNIDWYRDSSSSADTASGRVTRSTSTATDVDGVPVDARPIASGKRLVVSDGRYRVYRPHNSALSVLIIRRAKKRDAGIYRCNLAGSTTRHKYMVLNVTESKIEAQTSAATQRAKIGSDVTLWCNATGYPKPVVYWTREDRNRRLPDGTYQFWGNGLLLRSVRESETGIYSCYLDNFVQPIVSYKFSLMVEDNPWSLDGYKMRFDSGQWHPHNSPEPKPVKSKSYLLMCETRDASKPLPVIRWYRNGRAVRNNRYFYIIEDNNDFRSSYSSSTLVIMTFLPRFQGNYTCVASNVFRMKKQTFYINDYLHPDDVVDAVSSSQLPQPERLGRLVLPPSRHRPPSNAIQPVAEFRELRATLPGSEKGEHIGKRGEGSDGDTDGGETKVPDDEDKTGYSSGPDDDDDDN